VVRSLGRAGLRVYLGSRYPRSYTARSRYVSRLWTYDADNGERFCDQLEAFLRLEQPDYVFVVGESQLRRLIPHADRFEPLATWISPRWETVRRCFDKNEMYELARALGIPTQPWEPFSDAATWRKSARIMGYPVVIKRRDSSASIRGHKALIVRDEAQLDALIPAVERDPEPGSVLLQKFAPGVRHNCHIGASEGRLIAYFQQRVARTDELDQTGIGIEGVSVRPSDQLRGYCERLAETLRYHGIGCIQFLVDAASGRVAFLEINPRMDSTAALPYRLGLDYPRLALQLASQPAACEPLPDSYRIGARYHWLYGDFFSWYDALRGRQRTTAQLAAWAARSAWVMMSSHHLTWDWRDPLPTLHAFWSKLAFTIRKRTLPSQPTKSGQA
jgi:biotin carboxylase